MNSILNKLNNNLPLVVYRLPYGQTFYNNSHFLDLQHSAVFQFPGENFKFSDNPRECDLIVALTASEDITEQYEFFKNNFNNQYFILLQLFHFQENFTPKGLCVDYFREFKEFSDRIIPVHHVLSERDFGVYNDWLWNQEKVAFVDTKLFVSMERNSGGCSEKMYKLDEIKIPTGNYKLLCANRIRYNDLSDRSLRRLGLHTYLQGKSAMINDPERGVKFISQEDVDQPEVGFDSFHPIHNLYYQSTYVSVFVETLTHINTYNGTITRGVTEKTFNPLIKGHFILPFGYHGLIKDIRSYGFKLPDWIDYSYDNVPDTSDRFYEYLMSVDKILELSIQDLQDLYRRDIHMLLYNRELFFSKPYSNIYKGLREYLNKDNKHKKRLI